MPVTARSRHRPLLVAASFVLLASTAACGSDDDSAATTTEGTDDGAGTIVAEDFSLTDLTVGPGDEIVLQNDGAATHTATADDGSFDLGEVTGGETSDPATAPTTPGEYPFHCEIHNTMTATLTVES